MNDYLSDDRIEWFATNGSPAVVVSMARELRERRTRDTELRARIDAVLALDDRHVDGYGLNDFGWADAIRRVKAILRGGAQ